MTAKTVDLNSLDLNSLNFEVLKDALRIKEEVHSIGIVFFELDDSTNADELFTLLRNNYADSPDYIFIKYDPFENSNATSILLDMDHEAGYYMLSCPEVPSAMRLDSLDD